MREMAKDMSAWVVRKRVTSKQYQEALMLHIHAHTSHNQAVARTHKQAHTSHIHTITGNTYTQSYHKFTYTLISHTHTHIQRESTKNSLCVMHTRQLYNNTYSHVQQVCVRECVQGHVQRACRGTCNECVCVCVCVLYKKTQILYISLIFNSQ